MHANTDSYIQTYICIHMHTYVHIYIYTYFYPCIHTCTMIWRSAPFWGLCRLPQQQWTCCSSLQTAQRLQSLTLLAHQTCSILTYGICDDMWWYVTCAHMLHAQKQERTQVMQFAVATNVHTRMHMHSYADKNPWRVHTPRQRLKDHVHIRIRVYARSRKGDVVGTRHED